VFLCLTAEDLEWEGAEVWGEDSDFGDSLPRGPMLAYEEVAYRGWAYRAPRSMPYAPYGGYGYQRPYAPYGMPPGYRYGYPYW